MAEGRCRQEDCGGVVDPGHRTCWDCQRWRNRLRYYRRRSQAIPAEVRRRVVERDCGVCQTCRDLVAKDYRNPERWPELDHIIPLSRGGDSSEENLQLLCRHCNRSKGNR
jgi:5-methylcytosine-specific restriction endonuclease McrA